MSNTRSDSSESISIYETPINSPSNESLLNSTRIDSLLFGNASVITQSIDLLDFRQSFEAIPTSVATESTLRQTVQRLNSECIEDIKQYSNDMNPNSSVWYSSQTMSLLRNQLFDSNRSDLYVMLMKYISELEGQQLELIGVEEQIHSLSLKCRTIRENMSSKTNTISLLISQLLPKKQTAQKHTQTELKDSESVPQSYDQNKPFFTSVKSETMPSFPKSSASVTSEPNVTKNNSPKDFCDLSESAKKGLSRLPAMVKGYLTRRLMKTEKVLHKIETIRDTTQLLSGYRKPSTNKVTTEDINFHKRLIIQLERSCHEFYDIFFNYPKSAQMALIRRSRQHILERHYRTASVLSHSSYMDASFRNQSSPHVNSLSSVTRKVIQRKGQKSKSNGSHQNSFLSKNSKSNSFKSRPSSSSVVKLSTESINSSLRRSQRNTATNAVQTHKRKANFDNK